MDNRSGLIEAALLLFTSRGYEGVGVQEIVTTAGVTKPTLYHFFGSKLGLLEALIDTHAPGLDEAVTAACAYTGDLPATLDRLAAAYIDFSAAHPLYYRFELACTLAAPDGDPHRLARLHQRVRQDAIEAMFRAATTQHGNMRAREQRYAVSFVGQLNSWIVLRLDEQLVITDRIRRDLVHQFSHGIYS